MEKVYDTIIIGGGPGGITSAIELKNLGYDVLLLEFSTPGGKINVAPRVDNFPPFKEIPGPDLAFHFFEEMMKNEINYVGEEALNIEKNDDTFKVTTDFNTHYARSVIVATGTKEKKLGLENEDKFYAKGISYCALCDGHFYIKKDVALVGGDNEAIKEAIFLARLAKTLYVIHEGDFSATPKDIETLKSNESVVFLDESKITKLLGSDRLEEIIVSKGNKETTYKIDGLFPLIGHIPNTNFIHFDDVLDKNGYVIVNKNYMTSVPGLFAIGDVLDHFPKQIHIAVKDAKKCVGFIKEFLK